MAKCSDHQSFSTQFVPQREKEIPKLTAHLPDTTGQTWLLHGMREGITGFLYTDKNPLFALE
jgi:hypothetical protein